MKARTTRKVKKLKREIEKRKFPFLSVEGKNGAVTIHPLIPSRITHENKINKPNHK